jgi:hypothetical protein
MRIVHKSTCITNATQLRHRRRRFDSPNGCSSTWEMQEHRLVR